jgi:SAM-dependent methyltransferase
MLKEKILESSIGYALWSAPINRSKVTAIREMLARCEAEKKILDVGCGPGTNAAMFSGWDYVGIDLNPGYIETAKTKFPGKRFFCGDATSLDLKGEKFPVILINSLMHHLDNEECTQLLDGVRSILAGNGAIIVQEPLTPAKDQQLMRFLMKQDRGDYFRPLEEWRNIFRQSGFSIVVDDFYKMKLAGLVTGWQMYSVLLKTAPEL